MQTNRIDIELEPLVGLAQTTPRDPICLAANIEYDRMRNGYQGPREMRPWLHIRPIASGQHLLRTHSRCPVGPVWPGLAVACPFADIILWEIWLLGQPANQVISHNKRKKITKLKSEMCVRKRAHFALDCLSIVDCPPGQFRIYYASQNMLWHFYNIHKQKANRFYMRVLKMLFPLFRKREQCSGNKEASGIVVKCE